MTLNEKQIEQKLIAQLKEQKFTYCDHIRDKDSLEKNFRQKFEALNRVNLTDAEFSRLKDEIITSDTFKAAQILRERNTFIREDGTALQYTLVNINDWCKNEYEVINQLRINTENSHHRYDIILLINGIPVVQIELKTLEISTRRAMQQIVDYKNDPGNGYQNTLLCFMQLFIVSNESMTYYFANNQNQHFAFNADERFLPIYQLSDEKNEKINNLYDFSKVFLAKCTLGQLISRYMVLVVTEQKLMIMRPYQIFAVKEIVNCIEQNRGNGYIWHTTGSGKTLTSFKAATLLKDNPDIEKCLFVVDRKDLDRQTREEFNKFQDGCVEENTNTETLVRRLLSDNYADKVIVTTIQKLGLALDENSRRNINNKQKGKQTYKERLEPLKNKRIIFIFDECHRSQFGDNHKVIKDFFPNSQLFGFTGTPIFGKNASYIQLDGEKGSYKTTIDLFEKELHAYTITNAIEDKNVLRFHVDYFKPEGKDKARIRTGEGPSQQAVVKKILSTHDAATNNRRFNAILATSSINSAIEYYKLFKVEQTQKLQLDADYQPLNIVCVFSPPTQVLAKDAESNDQSNKNIADIKQLQEDLVQEKEDNKQNPEEKKAALIEIITNYNQQYKTNFSINEFDLYYQDVQQRIKMQQYSNGDYPHCNKIDITIVVDMLLTGFDAKYLNTLYVDKNLKYHQLIQAFSRTNRVLNDTKPYGNVLDFRGQQSTVDDAIKLFSGKDQNRAKEIWLVDSAPKVIEKLSQSYDKLQHFMQSQELTCTPSAVANLKGDQARGQFINLFKEVQRFKTQLEQYTDLSEEDKARIEETLPKETLRAFRGVYLDIAQDLKVKQEKDKNVNDPLQQLDFEFVLFASTLIDYDYIMGLIAQETHKTDKYKMTREQIIDMLKASSTVLDEREDFIAFINTLSLDQGIEKIVLEEQFKTFVANKTTQQVEAIAEHHQLEVNALQQFIDNTLNRTVLDSDQLSDLFASLELGWKERGKRELALMQELKPLLEKLAKGRDIAGLSAYE